MQGLAKQSINKMEDVFNQIAEATKPATDFESLAKPLIKYLCENHHPHCTIIVTSTGAELLEGVKHTGEILDFIKD